MSFLLTKSVRELTIYYSKMFIERFRLVYDKRLNDYEIETLKALKNTITPTNAGSVIANSC